MGPLDLSIRKHSGRAAKEQVMAQRLKQSPVVFGAAIQLSNESRWRPAADIYRTRRGWLVKYELAGVKAEDVQVSINGSQLTIGGCRRDWKLEEGSSHYSMEISYHRFERTLELPCDLKDARLQIEAREGILLIRILCEGEEP
jgi:HSP20 family protein